MAPNKTPSQHQLTLFILPQIQRQAFATPPNPAAVPAAPSVFETPGLSLFFQNVRGLDPSLPQPLSQAEQLRLWRHDALMQNHLRTAEFIGDKVLALTGDAADAFWLGQVMYTGGHWQRARALLTRPEYAKQVLCRYLAALCAFKLELWDDALDLVGETNPFHKDEHYQVTSDGGIKLEALMCYLRGQIFAQQNSLDRAKDCYKEAVLVDVKCYEAFAELVDGKLMTPREEWEFVAGLNFRNADDNAELVRLLYTLRLLKYVNVGKFEELEAILREEYDFGDNGDILLARADYLYVQCNFDECLAICERILARDKFNFEVLPHYLNCLYEVGGKNKLFLMAHQLAEHHSTKPITWHAIGIYYLSIDKVGEARKFFGKATLLNPNFGYAWIGFGHTFAAEGEHEQAISAYACAAKLYPGTHLPNLFLGMQHLEMNNLNLAEEYLAALYHICNTDPLLLNELGVINFHRNNLIKAELFFQEALAAARHLNSDLKTWISIHTNLGHVYRRTKQPYKALECFNQVVKILARNDAPILLAIGLVYLKLENYSKAVDSFHDALAISPGDPIAQDLLKRALELHRDADFFKESDRIFELNLPSLHPQEQDLDAVVARLKRGPEDSDGEVMDIE